MKKSVTLSLFLLLSVLGHAQWSNTTNQFYDSLHMPVSATTGDQKQPIVVKSYPDSGYFVIWVDYRNQAAGNGSDIYAQKFDKTGKALWTANGVPVVAGKGYQTFAPPSNADYRYYNYACTDSAGGFYIAWDDDNPDAGSTAAHRVAVQHMQSNGSAVFPFPGYVVASPAADFSYQYADPQLIADGNRGFFIGYIKFGSYNDMYVQCFRDEGGTMVNYGGGQMDVNGVNVQVQKACGLGNNINNLDARVTGFSLYPDLQGGCGVVMTMDWNTGGNERVFTGYNKLCRVKKESHVTVLRRSDDIATTNTETYTYKKDSVVRLYNYRTYSNGVSCKDSSGNVYVYTDYYVENGGNGYANISGLVYGTEYAKGVMIPTAGNININLIATCQRNLSADNSTVGYWYKRLYYFADEVYDSIPYQLASDSTDPYYAYRTSPEGKVLNKLNYGGDTILAESAYDYDFALAASANRIFAAGMVYDFPTFTSRFCKLQQLQVDRESLDSFAIHYRTDNTSGIIIGRELNTGFSGSVIHYDNPLITTDLRGNALFSITETGYSTRVSPIGDSAQLLWGPMGKPIGTGVYGGHFYSPENPFVSMSPDDGTAVVAWDDSRNNNSSVTDYQDVLMRHLDSLKIYDYAPPVRALTTLSYAGSALSPGVLYGTTGKWAEFDGFNSTTFLSTPVLSLSDNYNLGAITGGAYDYLQTPIRTTTDGKPYLSRDWTIVPEHNPSGAATIGVRLYFTANQFAQLQTADPSIQSPGDLIVIKQPSTGTNAPTEYIPASGDDLIIPTAWQPVAGGYYVELPVTSFSNFFIEKDAGILPVTWLSVDAQRVNNNTVAVSWSVASETNVKSYLVEYSDDGIKWKDGCTVGANNLGKYSCLLSLSSDKKYYFKVKETDLNSRWSISQTIWLDKLLQGNRFVLSPNPVHQDATLVYAIPEATETTLKLTNSAGVIVWQQQTKLSTAGTLTVPMSRLSSDIYRLQIITNKATQLLKVIKE